ncbi:MAG: hypothetical protein AAB425_12055, partial [Bdellovibrionota bacterium]
MLKRDHSQTSRFRIDRVIAGELPESALNENELALYEELADQYELDQDNLPPLTKLASASSYSWVGMAGAA